MNTEPVSSPTVPHINTDHLRDFAKDLVSVRTFFTDPYYMGSFFSGFSNRALTALEQVIVLDSTKKDQVRWTLSGSDAVRFAQLCLTRIVYELSCMTDPQAFFGLVAQSNVSVAVLGRSNSEASDTARGLILMLTQSPYFTENFSLEHQSQELRFPGGIWVASRSSEDTTVLGLNTVSALIINSKTDRPSGTMPGDKVLTRAIEKRVRLRQDKTGFSGRVFVVQS